MAVERQVEKSLTDMTAAGNALGSAFTRSAEVWLGAQADLLASTEAMMTDWLRRRREGIEASRRTVQEMSKCSDPADMLRVQQDWLSGVLKRVTEDLGMLNDSVASLSRSTTTSLEEAALAMTQGAQAANDSALRAAGNKPMKRTG
jgi:hypothetical protein